MRLKKIKLVGFKSFVDPTTIHFPSQLVAVVGPNGCGKSNTIDAVRWVMGESSAKNLRGESMTDVIFNGSLNRKPVGQASVELIFDNEQGRIVGEYAGYSEISIKRVVTRDAQSNYFLNGTKCRKKDVTDLFLGTGLGPRSYSIIGQGTISRVIEAKPDELRVFLEEAAGISKYKERRRDTENRIRHTRENLERVQDIRDELGKQIERLHRQAKAAEKYKSLKQDERLIKAQWHALKWNAYNQQLQLKQQAINETNLAKEQLTTKINQYEINIDNLRQRHDSVNENYLDAQGQYYQLGGEIARLEGAIQQQKLRRTQYEQDLSEAKRDFENATMLYQQDKVTINELNESIAILEPGVEENNEILSQLAQKLVEIEQHKTKWQQQWDDFNAIAHESSKQAHVEQANIQHLEQTIQTIQNAIEKNQQEKASADTAPLVELIEELAQTLTQSTLLRDELSEKLEQYNQQANQLGEQIKHCEEQIHNARSQSQLLQAEILSLETLQQAALGKQDKELNQWLSTHQLEDNKRLAELIDVESGWEKALEIVLADNLQAVCIERCDAYSQAISEFNQGQLAFIEKSSSGQLSSGDLLSRLADKVSTQDGLTLSWLDGIYVADSLADALDKISILKSHESIITINGVWVGKGWLKVHASNSDEQSVLYREQLIKEKQQTNSQLIEKLTELDQSLTTEQLNLEQLNQSKRHVNEELSQLGNEINDANTKLKVKQSQLEQLNERLTIIDEDIEDKITQSEEVKQELAIARGKWQQAMESMEGDSAKRESLSLERDQISNQLEQYKTEQLQLREINHDKELQLKSKQSQLSQLQQNTEREQSRIDNLSVRIEQLTQTLQQQDEPGGNSQDKLEEKLEQHLISEERLNEAKLQLEQVSEQIKQAQDLKGVDEKQLNQLLSDNNQAAIDAQTLKVRCDTVIEALAETQHNLKELIEGLPQHANEQDWHEQLQSIQQRIQRLGAINLAAIDEYKTESERKLCIDEQCEDLIEALQTLEDAIKKIDKETRTRFKQTFDEVNEGFKTLFPRLFGGGEAYLELTGDDLLDTGVTVMARPPGKRNSSIHLLSGGEKAMAAVALVFAIFRLNPSPFCMLDEVDAPLDDANVSRFCAMVKEMSESVQFVFITHNKVTMELADQLSGVTMNEPGVSRIVSVDVEEAISISQIEEVTA